MKPGCCYPENLGWTRPEGFLRLWLKVWPLSDHRISRHFPTQLVRILLPRKTVRMGTVFLGHQIRKDMWGLWSRG